VSGKLRIVLVDEKPDRAGDLRKALVECGYDVVAQLTERDDLRARLAGLAADVIIVDMQSPDRDVLEDMRRIHSDAPRPILMFVDESDSESIRAAVRAGVSAYVVGDLERRRVKPIVEVAIARFEEAQALRQELDATRERLEDRKILDRAKGLLMSRRAVSEEEAYGMLRKMAMDRKAKIVDIARQVVDMAELL
jgi:response regulator NasT